MYLCTVIIAADYSRGSIYQAIAPPEWEFGEDVCCVSKEMNILGKTPHGVGIMGTDLWNRI
jgi:hypothetical protein